MSANTRLYSFNVDMDKYKSLISSMTQAEFRPNHLYKEGYSALHSLYLVKEGFTDVKFLVIVRTDTSNLVITHRGMFALDFTIPENVAPANATFDDLIILAGQNAVNTLLTSQDVANAIRYTQLMFDGVIEVKDTLFCIVEIVISDKAFREGMFKINPDVLNADAYNIMSGLTPIDQVKEIYEKFFFVGVPESEKFSKVFEAQVYLRKLLKEVKNNG